MHPLEAVLLVRQLTDAAHNLQVVHIIILADAATRLARLGALPDAGLEYREHNPGVGDDKDAFIECFERMALTAEVHHQTRHVHELTREVRALPGGSDGPSGA